ncbi:MAG TPA: glycosyltransferase, partial [Verrucomicrobiae bacterium]|nr:glycosyltransferase [Verrucomicrobiae bacterium]
MIALGSALERRGHRIAFVSPLDAEAKVRRAAFEFIPVAAQEFPQGEWERTTSQMGELTGFKASRFAGKWLARFVRGILRDFPTIADREQFDGIVMDQVSLGTESVCAAMRAPLAVACCALMFHIESSVPACNYSWSCGSSLGSRLRNTLGQLVVNSTGLPVALKLAPYRFRHKLSPMGFYFINELAPSLVQVSQQPAFFDFPRRRLPDHFHYTGPWLERARSHSDFPWERLDGRPIIYASLGTLQNRLEHAFRIIAEACAGLKAQLVLALGNERASPPTNLPGNPVVVGYAPQQELIRRATLVIAHGGLNTTLETLSRGVPLIAIPITNDQPGVAARIKYLGVGEFIPIKTLTTEKLRAAVVRLLSVPEYRERAKRCGEEIQRENGADHAAGLIETAFSRRQRVTRQTPCATESEHASALHPYSHH